MSKEIHKSTLRCFLIVGNSVFGCFFFGYGLAYMNVSLDTVNYHFGISKDNQSSLDGLISALLPIGAAFGAFLVGPLLSKLSRKQAMIFTDIVGSIGAALGIITNLYILFISRFIFGVAVGLNSALIPMYIKEYTPLSLTGTMGSLNQLTVNTGILVALLMGLGYPADNPDNSYWIVVFLLPIIPNVLRTIILLFVFTDDPPGYYVQKGNQEKAIDVLKKIYRKAYVNEMLTEIERDERQKLQTSQKYRDLVSLLYKRRFFVGSCLCLLQQLCGINAVIFYSTNIFNTVTNNDSNMVNILNGTVGLVNIFFSGLAGILMKKLGRKALLVLGDILCFACLIGLGIFSLLLNGATENKFYQYMVLAFLFVYLIGFQLSLGPIVWIYIAEILPEKGVSLAVLFNWACVFLVTLTFPILNDNYGIYTCFFLFSFTCFVGLFFLLFLVKETKGKTAQDIDAMYSQVGNVLIEEGSQSSGNYTNEINK